MSSAPVSSATVSAGTLSQKTFLFISQVYVPDPASVGQHLHDAAAALVRRGHRVVVLTSGRGYEDPSLRYPAREIRDGVEILRIPMASFGKGSIANRLAGGLLFLAQATLRAVLKTVVSQVDRVLVSTSPPNCPWWARRFRPFAGCR